MRDGNDNLTVDLVGQVEPEKRGRGRPKKEKTLSAKQRTAAYRARLKRAEIDAIGFEKDASTQALLELLRSTIHRFENPDPAKNEEQENTARENCAHSIGKVLDVLRDRYVK